MNKALTTTTMGEDLHKRATSIEVHCCTLGIMTDYDYTQGDKKASEIASLTKGVKDYWKDTKSGAYDNWKNICAKEDEMLSPLVRAKKLLTDKLGIYRAERAKAEALKQQEAQDRLREEQEYEAFKLAEEGVAPEAVDAIMEAAEAPVQITPSQPELRGNTSFSVTYEVSIIPGKEHEIPLELLIPTTAGHIKAVLAKAKAQAKLTGGKPIPGIKVVQMQQARTRTA
jgi:hypothetical protein